MGKAEPLTPAQVSFVAALLARGYARLLAERQDTEKAA